MNGFGGHLVGEEIANKRLLSYFGKNKHNHHTWMWECLSCGESYGPTSISHMKRSAKCMSCNSGPQSGRWKGYKELTGVWLYQNAFNAKKKGRVYDVTPEYLWTIWEKQSGLCAYTGLQLTHGVDASLDRIDSSKGYIEGNVQWIHRDVNRMKSDFEESYFVSMCKLISSS